MGGTRRRSLLRRRSPLPGASMDLRRSAIRRSQMICTLGSPEKVRVSSSKVAKWPRLTMTSLGSPIGEVVLVGLGAPDSLRAIPVFVDDCPESLVEEFAAAKERFSQDALLHRANLAQCAIAAPVQHRRARFESVDAYNVERKPQYCLRTLGKQARTPELRRECKTPFRGIEHRIELPDLEEADRCVISIGNNREAEITSGFALADRPLNEALEALDRGRWRRDEPRDFLRGQQRQQRVRIRHPQLAKREAVALEHGQSGLPVGRNRRRRRCRR